MIEERAAMPNSQTQSRLSRRSFLYGLMATGIVTAGSYLLVETAPWLNYVEAADQIRQPVTKETTMSAAMRELVHYATLAASGHNAQPWRFALNDDSITIYPDYSRRLPAVDPHAAK